MNESVSPGDTKLFKLLIVHLWMFSASCRETLRLLVNVLQNSSSDILRIKLDMCCLHCSKLSQQSERHSNLVPSVFTYKDRFLNIVHRKGWSIVECAAIDWCTRELNGCEASKDR